MATPKDLSREDIAIVKARIIKGDKHQDIASDYRLNQGRITDIKYERTYPEIPPADLSEKNNELKPIEFDPPTNDQITTDLSKNNEK